MCSKKREPALIRAKRRHSRGKSGQFEAQIHLIKSICKVPQLRDAFITIIGASESAISTFMKTCSGKDAVGIGHGLMKGISGYYPLYRLIGKVLSKVLIVTSYSSL